MRGIIIYQGKYGATKQYARWLAESLSLPIIKAENVTSQALADYDLIILGASVYVGNLTIKKWLNQNSTELAQKKLFLFIVSGNTTYDPLLQQQVINNNLAPVIRDLIKIFFLPGKCNISELSLFDRLVLKMGAWLEKNPKRKAAMKTGFDEVNKKNLSPLLAAAGRLLKL